MKRPLRAILLPLALLGLAGCLSPVAKPLDAGSEPVPVAPRALDEWKEDLSQVRFQGVLRSVATIKSADKQTDLTIDLYRPNGIGGEPTPTILILSPYWAFGGYPKDLEPAENVQQQVNVADPSWLIPYFTARGYTLALADMRGTRNSGGCFDFGGLGDQQDGYAIVEWLGTQAWSNGKVGMYGVSHVGMSQVAAAVANPPHLTTIVPIAAIHSFYRYLYFDGTHYDLNMFTPPAYTAVATLPPTDPTSPAFARSVADTGCRAAEYNAKGTSQDGRFDAFWRERDYPSQAAQVNTSIFFVHGLVDSNVKFDHVDAMWRAMAARDDAPFIKGYFGQWGHQEPPTPDWRFVVHRWFDHWLLGIDTGILDEPRVTIQDSNKQWRNETVWPPTTGDARFYLAPGKLQLEPGTGAESFQDVPAAHRNRDPQGSYLTYSSGPISEDLHISGTPRVTLETTSDKASTHYTVLLFDVTNGAAKMINRGYLDSKQRNGLEKDEPMTPGQKVVVNVSLFPDDYVVQKGHELQILVKSSDNCGYVVAPVLFQCGPTGIVSDVTAAKNTIHYGVSGLHLPLDRTPGVTR